MADRGHMQSYWDARARENALYFVDNNVEYGSPDEERFWKDGQFPVDRMLELLGVEVGPADDVVEIGCGVGRLTRVLAGRAASVTALDVSAEMLARARELNSHLHNVTWVHGDGTTLTGIGDATADACFSYVVFQHIPDPRVTLGYVGEMGRVLRAGGWSAFHVSNAPRIHRPARGLTRVREWVRHLVGRSPRPQDDPAWLGSAVDLGDLRRTAESAGMRVERVTGEGTQFCFVLLRKG